MSLWGWWRIVHASAALEWRRLRRNRWDGAMALLVPVLAVLLMWWIFSAGLVQRLPVAVVDEDHSALSRQAVRWMQATQGLDVRMQPPSLAQAQALLRSGEVVAVVYLPAGLARQVRTGRAASVTLLHNAQWSLFSGLVQRDVRAAVGTLSAGIELRIRASRGLGGHAAQAGVSPLSTHMVGLFNASGNYQVFLATSLMPAVLHILAMTMGAWALGHRLRDGSVGAWLRQTLRAGAAPSARLPLWGVLAAITGTGLWPLLGMGAGASVACALMTTQLHAPAANWAMAWAGMVALMGVSVALGMCVAALTLSLRVALSVTGLVTAPAFAYSGVAYPLLAMPAGAHAWAMLLPLTHYAHLQIQMLTMQAPWAHAVWPLAGMATAAVVLMLLAAWALRRAYRLPHRWGAR